MGWKLDEAGLSLDGTAHYDEAKVRGLVKELRKAPNYPSTICDAIEQILRTGKVEPDVVWRLSKWCHWPHDSQYVARKIAAEVFHGHVPRRFLNQKNEPTPSADEAVRDYDAWRDAVVGRLPVEDGFPLDPPSVTSTPKWESIRRMIDQKAKKG
jgi:hypothetical protein